MTGLSKWLYQMDVYQRAIVDAEKQLSDVKKERDEFLGKTVGFRPGEFATLEGTVMLVSKVIDMKKADEEKNDD